MRLFCIPYAGGTAKAYSQWKEAMDDSIEVIAIELPGRGTRFSEPLCDNMNNLVNQICDEYKDKFNEEEYMIYGHSMGALIAFYLTDKIRERNIRIPSRLFFSGKESPDIVKKDKYFSLNDEEFLEAVCELGGIPKEITQDKQCLNLFLPIFKNDYRLVAAASKYDREIKAFDCDITIFNGLHDEVSRDEIYGWNKFTNKSFKVYDFDGSHFFIQDYFKDITSIIYQQTIK